MDYYDDYDELKYDDFDYKNQQTKSQITFGDINNFYDRIKAQLQELSLLLNQDEDDCLKIYKHYGWNKEKLEQNYFDQMDEVSIKAGITPKEIQKIPQDQMLYCNIACEQIDRSQFLYLKCQHYFSKTMWIEYLECNLKESQQNPFYKCMQPGCNMIVPESMIIQLVDKFTFQLFKKALGKDYSTLNKKVKICTYPNCFLYAESEDLYKQEIVCQCEFKYCSSCQQESHDPCNCEQVQNWMSQNIKNAANVEWIKQNSKLCPNCQVPIQKNAGCNHITCSRCKHEFCWLCLGNWQSHQGTNYKCNQYKMNNDKQTDNFNEKNQLQKYLFFFERWNNSQKQELHCKNVLLTQMEELTTNLHKKLQINTIQLDFLVQSVRSLQDCRRILKWSYSYGFFIKDQAKRQLYEFQQKDFEMFCEKLHFTCEKVPVIHDLNGFQVYQLELQNLKISCEQYMKNFLNGIKNEQL